MEITENTIFILEKIEEIFSLKGCLRVLCALWNEKSSGLRYSEIQKKTKLPAGTLNKALNFLIKKGFIETHTKYIPGFRRHPISMYSLTNMGKKFCDELFSEDAFFETIRNINIKKWKEILK
jgi:DNA-binding HxlR family transcriptional regulator